MPAEATIAAKGEARARPWIGAELKARTGLTIPIAASNLAEMAMAVTLIGIAALLGYWVAGVGSGLGLRFALGMGPAGLWTGLAVGLAVAGAALTWRFRAKSGALLAAAPA